MIWHEKLIEIFRHYFFFNIQNANIDYRLPESHMPTHPHQSAIDAALTVVDAHFAGINAQNADAVAATLHFPHYRLSQGRLQTWPGSESYLADFRARAGDDWHHSSLDRCDIVTAGPDKVHVDVQFTRSLWVISCLDERWAAQLRSSFAD